MEIGSIEGRALAAACAVAAERGVPCGQAAVISSRSNVVVHLRPSPVVARVMSGTVALHEDPELWLEHEVSVLSFLAPSGLAVAPSSLIHPGPYHRDGLWMTFCESVEHPRQADLGHGAERLAGALRGLHDELAGFSGDLPGLADLRDDVERLHRHLRPSPVLPREEIDALHARLMSLGETVFESPLPAQALHGDASLSNLLCSAGERLVWNDFEDTFRGPVHWDLAGYVMDLELHGARPELVARALEVYGGIDRRELAPFVAAHDVYGAIWRAYVVQRRAEDGRLSSPRSSPAS